MVDDHQRIVQLVVNSAAIGGFMFVAMAGWVLAFDASSIATLIAGATEKELLSALFIGGSLTKGITIGTAFGITLAVYIRKSPRRLPATTIAPVAA
jgi:hypothetical protein